MAEPAFWRIRLRWFCRAFGIGAVKGLMDVAALFVAWPWRWRDVWLENEQWWDDRIAMLNRDVSTYFARKD